MSKPVVIISGGFDPLHSGHLNYINAASELGDVHVIVNDDWFLMRKKGKPFLPQGERMEILSNIKGVVAVHPANNKEKDDVSDEIHLIKKSTPQRRRIIFANGGDRNGNNIPEYDTCRELDIELVFNIGGEKTNSSSDILANWEDTTVVKRDWGDWKVLLNLPGLNIKLKQLNVGPHKSLSMQRHFHRKEFWFVQEGSGIVNLDGKDIQLVQGDTCLVDLLQWHQLRNNTVRWLRIVELQYGDICIESDIERALEEE